MGNVIKVSPVIDYEVIRDLCKRPYPGHDTPSKMGCPNYGTRPTCPPQAPLLKDIINLDLPVYVVFNIFPFGEWVEKRRKDGEARLEAGTLKKMWSERQLANCLYWQPKARKQLGERIAKAVEGYNEGAWKVLECPEACGVNVTATMKSVGHDLEWPPKTVTYQVALIGRPVGGVQ